MTNRPKFIEISHPIEMGMKTYSGLPEPQAEILSKGGFLHAVPIAWVGGATFPVRAYVMQFQ